MAKHKKLEPIRLEDLEDAVRHSGLESVLRFEPQQLRAIQRLPPVETNIPVSTPVDTSEITENKATDVTNPVETSGIVSTPVDTLPAPQQQLFLSRVRKRLFRPNRPSEGHTDGEDRLYQFMWEHAQRHSPGVRCYSGSISVLARALGRDDRNVRPLVESLTRKLSIQVARQQDYRSGTPRMYFVMDYAEIARRRAKAGLTWAIKNKGIQLLTEQEARLLARQETVSTPVNTAPYISTPVDTIPPTVSSPVETTVSSPVETREYKENKTEKKTSSTATALVCNAIINVLGMVDDNAVALLIRKCRQRAPDATDEEIAELAAFQARRIVRMRNVDNPVGLLIDQAPRCFEGEPFARYRREKAEEAKRLEGLYG